MIDPDYFFDEDDSWPDEDAFNEEDEDAFNEEPEELDGLFEQEHADVEEVRDEFLNVTGAGMAFALAEEIADSRDTGKYDLTERTDDENWAAASRYVEYGSDKRTKQGKLRPFEQLVDDICKGRRSLFD